MFELPTPHGDKLSALLGNQKLPESDRPRVEEATRMYNAWIGQLNDIQGSSEDAVAEMVSSLNDYKLFVDLGLIFDSTDDFLYRQKGQLKLDNSIIEEFLPHLVSNVYAEQLRDLELGFGPINCFSAMRFAESIKTELQGAGMVIRSKDQDFAITRKLFIRVSHDAEFRQAVTEETSIAYVASEIKTNLGKTMFQEAAGTALDVKALVPGAKYYLLCEWVDMTPINTSTTAIDEIIILRRAKRLPSNVRSSFSTSKGRIDCRPQYSEYLTANPLALEPFLRFLEHVGQFLASEGAEDDVLSRGYF